MAFRVVIPARFDSSRLPGKALLPLAGKPMLQWVHERARACGAVRGHRRHRRRAHRQSPRAAFGAEVAMTARTHVSGTDRIAEVAATRGWADADIVVNVQGDEPLIPPRGHRPGGAAARRARARRHRDAGGEARRVDRSLRS